MNYRGTLTIHAFGQDPFGDENTPAGEFIEDMNQSGIVFHHTPTAHKDARREMIREELRDWVVGNGAPANVMAILRDISDDKDFARYLGVLRSIDYNVVIAQPQNALGQLSDLEWLCSRLGDRFLPRSKNSDSYTEANIREIT
ncbi:putative endonuclease or glycosyl hydrolase [Raphanus sativus]|nr:putative endonuclease or glycosyl hydrolase [Raphanus sativus]